LNKQQSSFDIYANFFASFINRKLMICGMIYTFVVVGIYIFRFILIFYHLKLLNIKRASPQWQPNKKKNGKAGKMGKGVVPWLRNFPHI